MKEQSDLGPHGLPFLLHLLNAFYCKTKLFKYRTNSNKHPCSNKRPSPNLDLQKTACFLQYLEKYQPLINAHR